MTNPSDDTWELRSHIRSALAQKAVHRAAHKRAASLNARRGGALRDDDARSAFASQAAEYYSSFSSPKPANGGQQQHHQAAAGSATSVDGPGALLRAHMHSALVQDIHLLPRARPARARSLQRTLASHRAFEFVDEVRRERWQRVAGVSHQGLVASQLRERGTTTTSTSYITTSTGFASGRGTFPCARPAAPSR